jgi:hypothetical protein
MLQDDLDAPDPLAGSLSHAEPMVLAWQSMPGFPDGAELGDLNRRASAVLALLGSLDEPLPLAEDEPQIAAQLQRLDQKLDLLLDLVGHWLSRDRALPAAQPARISVVGVVWLAQLPPGPGRIDIYLHASLPVALQLPAVLQVLADGRMLAKFQGLDAQVTDGLERYIFRRHRRAVAQTRRPG